MGRARHPRLAVDEDTKDADGASCAVALRFATEELLGDGGVTMTEAKEVVHMLCDLPDLWDVNIAAWYNDSIPSRFAREGAQEPFIDWVKKVITKPVVGVGRFTSPDTMVSQIRRGILDLIGAARCPRIWRRACAAGDRLPLAPGRLWTQ